MPQIFSVETRSSAALVVGEGNILAPALISALKQQGVFAVDPNYSLYALLQTHDLDYLVIFAPLSLPQSWFNSLASSLTSQSPKVVLVRHYSIPAPSLPLTVSLEIVYTDFVGPKKYFSPTLSAWEHSLLANNSLTIPGDGLNYVSFLSQDDLVTALATTIYSSPAITQLFLTSDSPVSLLNLAYELRTLLACKINLNFDPATPAPTTPSLPPHTVPQSVKLPDLLVTFVRSLPPRPSLPHQSVKHKPSKNLAPSLDLPVAKPARLSPFTTSAPVFVPLTSPQHSVSLRSFFSRLSRLKPHFFPHHFSTSPSVAIVTRGLIIALALYLSALTFSATITILSLRALIGSSLSTLPANSSLSRVTTTFIQANLYAVSLIPPVSRSFALGDLSLLLDAYQQFLVALPVAQQLSSNASSLATAILGHYGSGKESFDLPFVISNSRLQAETLYQQLSLLDGTLPPVPPTTLPVRFVDNYTRAKNTLGELKRSVLMSKGVLSILPDLIGIGNRRKYGVLFQNNMELRATGGFIGSFAILSFDNGTLYDMSIYDVYAADGVLKGHVEPPQPIKDYLGEANWYLRDSNFDPDFPTSARRAEWFIQKTLGTELDGIFALNLDSLRSLLTVTGPLTVPDYAETITAGNLYERAQYYAEVNFFPGSTQKKEFLSAVGNALFTQLSRADLSLGLPALTSLLDSLSRKDIMLSLKRHSTEHVLATLGWNGAILTPPDSVMVVDSNFGVNKANYYVSRDIKMLVTLDKSLSATHTLRLRYQNAATSDTWPAGPYKNYSRIYLPANSTITALKVKDQVLNSNSYTVTSEHDRTVVGFLFTVPINSSLGVELTYQTPLKLSGDNPSYSWYWQKQPGSSAKDSLAVYLNYPLYLTPSVIAPIATLNPQQLQFDFENNTDHRISVQFAQ